MSVKTGINELDEALGGGLREKANVLLIGPPGPEKLKLALKFLQQGKKEGDGLLYITTDATPDEINKEYGDKDLMFIDCYSWTLGNAEKNKEYIYVPGPSALNDLSIGIAQAMQKIFKPEKKMRIVVQSLSTLLLYNNPEVVYRFTQVIGARLKISNATTLFMIEEGMHDEKVVTTLKHLMNSVIEIKNENGEVKIRAPMDGINEWKTINI